MNRSVVKDFLRELKNSFSRFVSIFFIVLVGVAFFAGIKAAVPDMQYTADRFYDESRLYDIRVFSPLGLTEDDITALAESEGVARVDAGYMADVITRIDSRELVFRVHSLPTNMNQLIVTKGRLPEASGECVIEDSKNVDLDLALGDTIKLSSGRPDKTIEESLARDEFTIVGTVRSADYLTYEKGHTDLGSGSINFFMMIPPEDFSYPVYVEALIEVADARELNSFSKQYEHTTRRVLNQVENLGGERAEIRAQELRADATKELNEAKKTFAEQEKEFDDKIGQAEKDLAEAKDKLVSGEATLETEQKNLERTLADGWAQVHEGEQQLAAAQSQYDQSLASYNTVMTEHGDQIAQLNQLSGEIDSLYQNALAGQSQMEASLQNTDLTQEERANQQAMLDGYSQLVQLVEQTNGQVGGLNNLAQGSITSAESQLASAGNALANSRNQLEQAKFKLVMAEQEGEAQFKAARSELDAGWAEYREGEAEYNEERAEGEKQLQDGRERIIRAENEIERLAAPKWFVLDRESNIGLMTYKMTTQRMNAIAGLFPVFFILVAALVCLTTMTRMVTEQRSLIGAYKALGYSNLIVSFKYVSYAALASLSGALIGITLGMSFFPKAIFEAWSMMFIIPEFLRTPQWPLAILSVLVATLTMMGVAYWATRQELQGVPAVLLRPKPPTGGSRILLERFKGFWRRLSFMQKVTSRNIFRYKKRFWMTVAGVMGCSALLLAGLGMNNSVSQVVDQQFGEIFQYDMAIGLSLEGDVEGAQAEVKGFLEDHEHVTGFIPVSNFNAEVDDQSDVLPLTLIVPQQTDGFSDYIALRQRHDQTPIELDGPGIVISEKLARTMDVTVGDYLSLRVNEITKKVEIKAITEQYVFHYGYMDPAYYETIFRRTAQTNGYQVHLAPEADAQAISDTLSAKEEVANVLLYKMMAESFDEQVSSLQSIVALIIISAGILAFVVLYNLSNINITERIREIATLKVLGFFNREVTSYVYREIFILALVGCLSGLMIGIGLHRLVMVAIEQDNIMFGYAIEPMSFVYAFLLTMSFTVLVNLVMYRKLVTIPMVESLKSIE